MELALTRTRLVVSSLLTATLVSIASVLPAAGVSPPIADAIRRASAPLGGLNARLDRLFATDGAASTPIVGAVDVARSLGPNGPTFQSDAPVLRVAADQALYWRATSMDRYTGRSMTTSEVSSSNLAAEDDLSYEGEATRATQEVSGRVTVLTSRLAVALVPDSPNWS